MIARNASEVIKTTHKEWHPNEAELNALNRRAEELWPDDLPFSQQNREKWKHAVHLARNTEGGWVLDPGSSPRKYF